MRAILFSDIQAVGSDSNYKKFRYTSRLSCVHRSLLWIAELAVEKKPDYIICLGDVAQIHSMIDIPANNAIFDAFKKIAAVGPQVLILSGNHDLDTRNSDSSYVQAMESIPNVKIYLDPVVEKLGDTEVAMLPFSENYDEIEAKKWPAIALSHCTISGVPLAPGVFDKGLSESFIRSFRTVFVGHYHEPATYFGNTQSVGSLLFNDFNDDCLNSPERGAVLVNFTNNQIDFFANPYTPYYVTIRSRKALDSYTRDRKRTCVRIAYDEPEDLSGSFLKVYKTATSKVEQIKRANIKLDSDPTDAVKEYGRVQKMSDLEIAYGAKVVSNIGYTPKASLMSIDFMHSEVRNFMGVGKLDFDYDTVGVRFVWGENKDETCSKSSGAGKSSALIEPLVWAFWDCTIRGLKSDEVLNDDIGKDCYVYVSYKVNGELYEIIRTRNLTKTDILLSNKTAVPMGGNSVALFKNGSAVGKYSMEETNKLIQETHGVSWNAFVSLLIMGSTLQGDYASFTRLGPFDRVAFIEGFVSWLEVYPRAYESVLAESKVLKERFKECEGKIPVLEGFIRDFDKDLRELDTKSLEFEDNRVKQIEAVTKSLTDKQAELQKITDSVKKLKEDIATIEEKKSSLPDKSKIRFAVNELNSQIYQLRADVKTHRADIANLVASICPRCKQGISDEHRSSVVGEAEKAVQDATKKEQEIAALVASKEKELEEIEKLSSGIDNVRREYDRQLSQTEGSYRLLEKDINYLEKNMKDLAETLNPHEARKNSLLDQITKAKIGIETIKVQMQDISKELDVVNVWVKGFSPTGVRSFVIDNILNTLNSNITSYCNNIFAGDIFVSFAPEMVRGKFSIGLKMQIGKKIRNYVACSGGEKRRVDLVCSLALRDLALNLCNSVWNLAIFDEATDALDEHASELVVKTIRDVAMNVLVISHNPFIYSILDKCVRVEKLNGIVSVALED